MKKNLQFTKQTYLLLLAFLLVMSCFAGCAKKSAQEEASASSADLPISYMSADLFGAFRPSLLDGPIPFRRRCTAKEKHVPPALPRRRCRQRQRKAKP